jgi:fibronectin-binding autotransporter adhesin
MSSSVWDGMSGSWSTAAQWSSGIPAGATNAVFDGNNADTVTFATSDALAGVIGNDALAIFDMAGGTLVVGSWDWAGAFVESDGTMSVAGEDPVFSGLVMQAGGTLIVSSYDGYQVSFAHGLRQTGGVLDVTAGPLALIGAATLAGAVEGVGTLLVGGADSLTFGVGAVIAAHHIEIAAGGLLAFATNAAAFTVLGDLDLDAGATLSAPNAVVTLAAAGAGRLAGSVTLARLAVDGAYDLGGLSLGGTATVLELDGAEVLDGSVLALGQGSLTVGAGGTLTWLDAGLLAGSPGAQVAGSPGAQAAGSPGAQAAVMVLTGQLDQAALGTDTLAVARLMLGGAVAVTGVLDLVGGQALLDGVVLGGGTLAIGAGESATLTVGLLDQAGLAIGAGGTLDVAGNNEFGGTLAAAGALEVGGTLTLGTGSTGTLAGALLGGGTLVAAGQLVLAGDVLGSVLAVQGQVAAAPGATIGLNGALIIEAGGTLDVTAVGTLAAASLNDGGMLYDSGAARLTGSLAGGGTIDIAAGVLTLGPGGDMLTGRVEGAGTLAIAGAATLAPGVVLAQAGLALAGGTLVLEESLAYGGRLSGAGTIATDGLILNVQAGQLAGLITGGGTVQTAGAVDEGAGNSITLSGSGTTLLDSFMFTADGAGLVLGAAGDSTGLAIGGGATFAITDAAAITTGEAGATVQNAGIIEVAQTDPLGPGAVIAVATLINTGSIVDAAGALTIVGDVINTGLINVGDQVTITGAIGGASAAGLMIDTATVLDLGGAVGAGQVVDFANAGGTLALGDAAGFAGTVENFGEDFGQVNVIDLLGQTIQSLAYANGTLSLFAVTAGVTRTISLDAPGLNRADLELVADGAGGTRLQGSATATQNAPPGISHSTALWYAPDTGNADLPQNWVGGVTPASGALLVLPSASTAYEAVFTDSFTAYGLTAGSGATVAVAGGSLALENTLSVAGTLLLTGGTLEAVANPAGNQIATLALAAAGVLQADAGTLTIGNGLGALAGALDGGGAIALAGTVTLGASANLQVATLVTAGTTSLAGGLFYYGDAFINTGTLSLGADNLLLGFFAVDELAGRITGTGTVTDDGFAFLDGTLDANLLDVSVAQGAGTESLTGGITIAAGAALTDAVITGSGTLVNAGVINGGAGQSFALARFATSGTVAVGAGTLAVSAGSGQLGGVITGAGALALTAGAFTLAAGVAVSVATLALAGATLAVPGSLTLADAFVETSGLLTTSGGLTLSSQANSLSGAIAGGGTVDMAGGGLSGLTLSATALAISGAAALGAGGVNLTSGAALDLQAGATLALAGGISGAGTLNNAGLLQAGGIGMVTLAPGLFDNTGVIEIDAGTLKLATGGTLGGTVSGAGALVLTAVSGLALAADFADAVTLAAGSFALGGATFANGLVLAGATLGLGGQSLDLVGTGALAGTISGGGGVTIGGDFSAGTLNLTATSLEIDGVLAAAGPLPTTGIIDIGTAGTVALIASAPLGGAGARLVNDGLLEKIADLQTSTLTAGVLNVGTIAVAAGTLMVAGSLVNDGELAGAGLGAVSLEAVGGTGTVLVGAGGVSIGGAVAAGQSFGFSEPGTLTLYDPAAFAGTIAGTLNGDVIDLPGVNPASLTTETLAGGVLTLASAGETIMLALGGAADFTQTLLIGTDGGAGTEVTMPCFATGTAIATPGGPRPVEALRPGDGVLTEGGEVARIVWTGRRRLELSRHPDPAAVRPIRILAGAFGPGLPVRDLRLSPNHAVAIGGVLIEAGRLVNGATIIRERATPVVTYHHIELARHGLLLAEDLAVESFRDTGSRAQFAQAQGAAARAQPPCRPPGDDMQLAAARGLLLARAEVLGFARTSAPELTARTVKLRLRPHRQGRVWQFAVPEGLSVIELLSPACRPAELAAGPADPRLLGAALASLVLQTPRTRHQIDLAHEGHSGLYECEPGRGWTRYWTRCWTNGHARIALPPYAGPAVLQVRLDGAVERWERAP